MLNAPTRCILIVAIFAAHSGQLRADPFPSDADGRRAGATEIPLDHEWPKKIDAYIVTVKSHSAPETTRGGVSSGTVDLVVTRKVSGPLLNSFTTRYEISTDTSGYGNPPDVIWPDFANVGPNDLFLIFINRESHRVDTLISIPTIDDGRVHECNLVLDLSRAATDDQKVAVVEAALKNSPGPWVLDYAFLIASRDLASSRENWMLQLCQKHLPSPSASATQPTNKPTHGNFDNTSLAGTQATFRFILQTATTSSTPANRLAATRLVVRWMAARPLICADAFPLLAQVVNISSVRSSEILSPAEKADLLATITALPAPSPPLATLKKQCLDWLAGDH